MAASTLSDVLALSSKLDWWDSVAYISTGLVFVGVVGESIAELTSWISRYSTEWNNWTKKASALLLIVGLAGELVSLIRSSELTGQLVAQLNGDTQTAKLQTQRLHKENLQLVASLSPRLFIDQAAAGKALEDFQPIKVVIEYLPDWECEYTAGQIAFVLAEAHWTLRGRPNPKANPDAALFFPEVTVANNVIGGVAPTTAELAEKAMTALLSQLNKTNIMAEQGPPDDHLPGDVLIVRVGLRPKPRLTATIPAEKGISGQTLFMR